METLINQIFENDLQLKRINKEISSITHAVDPNLFVVKYQSYGKGLRLNISIEPAKIGLKYLNHVPDASFQKQNYEDTIFGWQRFYGGRFATTMVHELFQLKIKKNEGHHQYFQTRQQTLYQGFQVKSTSKKMIKICYYLSAGTILNKNILCQYWSNVKVCKLSPVKIKTSNSNYKLIILNSSAVMFFDILNQDNTILFDCQPLNALMSIKKKTQRDNYVTLTWQDEAQKNGRIQNIEIENSNNFIETIVKLNEGSHEDKKINEKDVTMEQYKTIDINQIIAEIVIMESDLQSLITIELVNSIMNHYQKAIEYYSAINNPLFENFIERLHQLLSREDVQLILQSVDEIQISKDRQQTNIAMQQQQQQQIEKNQFNQFEQSQQNNIEETKETEQFKSQQKQTSNEDLRDNQEFDRHEQQDDNKQQEKVEQQIQEQVQGEEEGLL